MSKLLLASIHDVGPRFEREVDQLADLTGYAYYSGVRFALYAQGSSDAVLRG